MSTRGRGGVVLVLAAAVVAVAAGCGAAQTPRAPKTSATSTAQTCPLSHSVEPWTDQAVNQQFVVRQNSQEYLITISATVLDDAAFNTLSAPLDGKWSVASGGLSLQGPPTGLTVLGVRGAGDVFRAPDLPVVACDSQDHAYALTTLMTYDNDPAEFMWLFDVANAATSTGPYHLVVNDTVVVNLGPLGSTP